MVKSHYHRQLVFWGVGQWTKGFWRFSSWLKAATRQIDIQIDAVDKTDSHGSQKSLIEFSRFN